MLHFYEGQVRKFLTQFIRILSNFSVETGRGSDGQVQLRAVPVVYGDPTRQVANIIRNNSENALAYAPKIACYVRELNYDRERMQNPYHIEKQHLKERAYDESTGEYTNQLGAGYTIEKVMPSPFRLEVTADIWSSNTDQKLQIMEQILYLFNPDFEIQKSDNYIDWTSLSYVELTGVTFSSRTIPVGADSEIDVATLTFSMPIWLSPPVKVKKLGVIQKIIMSIYDDDGGIAKGSDRWIHDLEELRDTKQLWVVGHRKSVEIVRNNRSQCEIRGRWIPHRSQRAKQLRSLRDIWSSSQLESFIGPIWQGHKRHITDKIDPTQW
jgi:hypothetical protein